MKALDHKLLRDLRQVWSQALTLALVVASGVAGFITNFSAWDALERSRQQFYAEARFADVFASLKRAPAPVEREIAALPGVAHVQTSVAQVVQITLASTSDPLMGLLVGLDRSAPPELNRVFLRSGQRPGAGRSGTLDVLVSEAFAAKRALRPGDSLEALLNGRRQSLRVSGIALSPEYVFAGLAGTPDPGGFGVFWMDREALAAASQMQGAFNQVAVRLAPGASEPAVIDALDRVLAPWGGAGAQGRDGQVSHRTVNSELQQLRVMGTVLPAIFLAVAAFLLQVVLGRQIAIQREQIAALMALGYPPRRIALHYLQLAGLIVAAGLILGLGLGSLLGHWFMGLYEEVFRFPQLLFRIRWELFVSATAITGAAALLATWRAVQDTVRMAPAEAMRPPAPGLYRRTWLEATALGRRLRPGARMVLRNLQRRPGRAAVTVAGIAASMAVLISGTFWRDTVDLMLRVQFQQVLRGQVVVGLIDPRGPEAAQELARLPGVHAVESARSVLVRLSHGQRSWRGSLTGRTQDASLQQVVDAGLGVRQLPADGLLLTDRLARRLDAAPGDVLRIEMLEGARRVIEMPLAATVEESMGLNAYLERRSLNHLLREGDLANVFTLGVDRGAEAALLQALRERPRVASAFSKATLLRNIEEITARNLLVFSAVLTVFAAVIAIGVVYNQSRIALAERAWELASLRVLGFTRQEVSALLLGELALQIALALPLGMLAGHGLAGAIIALVSNDEFAFPVLIRAPTYAGAALCVVAAGAASAWVVQRRIAGLDLVGVLKTRE